MLYRYVVDTTMYRYNVGRPMLYRNLSTMYRYNMARSTLYRYIVALRRTHDVPVRRG